MKGLSHGIVAIEQDGEGAILRQSFNKAPFFGKLFCQYVEFIMHVRAWRMNRAKSGIDLHHAVCSSSFLTLTLKPVVDAR